MDTIPRCFPILRYPSETIDLIIFHVTSPSDLLHLALTCRALCHIIIPSHLEFRSISYVPKSEHVWKYLIDCPAQARMVRSLRLLTFQELWEQQYVLYIGSEKRPYGPHKWRYSIPSHPWLDDEVYRVAREAGKEQFNYDDERNYIYNVQATVLWEEKRSIWLTVCCAVKQMPFLEEFTWTQNDEIPEDVVSHVACVLKDSCPYLRHVTGEYLDHPCLGMRGTILPDGLTLKHLSIWAYSSPALTHLSMKLELRITAVKPDIIVSTFELIGKSYPNLRSLALYLTSYGEARLRREDFYALFINAHWPKLESLAWRCNMIMFRESNFKADSWKEICQFFFRRHPLISSLTLFTVPSSTALLGENTNELLSNLKTFHINGKLSKAFCVSALPRSLHSGSETSHGLVSLSCSISSRCIAILERLPNLRLLAAKLEEHGTDTLKAMLEVLGRTTSLERLDIEPRVAYLWGPQELIPFFFMPCTPFHKLTTTLGSQINSLVQQNSSPYHQPRPLLSCLTHLILRKLRNSNSESISDLIMTPLPIYPLSDGGKNFPVASSITSLLTMMPNLKYLKINHEQVWVSQSPGDTDQMRISFKPAKEEVEPSHLWHVPVD